VWVEFHIINGPSTQTATVHIDAAETEGIVASFGEINPLLLVIIVLLSISLIGLITYGLKDGNSANRKFNPAKQKKASKSLPSMEEIANAQKGNETEVLSEGNYSGVHSSSSPGENPYQ